MSRESAGQRKVTIVGAGIIGVSSAIYLQRDGYDVTIVDGLPPRVSGMFSRTRL